MTDLVERLRFDPTQGHVIRRPPGAGYGFWVGGHKVSYDRASGQWVLFYRMRTPLEQGRGGRCAVAVSPDGWEFETVWEADKSEFASSSIEVGHVVRHSEHEWRLYVSYERAGTSIWRVDMLTAPDPSEFRSQYRRTVLDPSDFGLDYIKDPWIIRSDDGGYDLYAAVSAPEQARHDTTGVSIGPNDATVRAQSADGVYFERLDYVYTAAMDGSWHGQRGRLDCAFPFGDQWIGTFSGGRTMYDNYEEPCGLAAGSSVDGLHRLTTDEPWIVSPHGCVRYVWGVPTSDGVRFFYEYTTEDGSHELRVSHVDNP